MRIGTKQMREKIEEHAFLARQKTFRRAIGNNNKKRTREMVTFVSRQLMYWSNCTNRGGGRQRPWTTPIEVVLDNVEEKITADIWSFLARGRM